MELARVRAQYDLDLEMERERRAQLVARQNALSSKLQAATAQLVTALARLDERS